MNTSWRSQPAVRLAAAALSWFLFALCFTLLYQTADVVIGLGGYCASGGPYVIEVECPQNVVLWAPLSIFGGLAAVGVSFLAGGFGAPIGPWAWSILFVGLGIAFALGGNWITAVIFVAMGAVPIVLELRANVARTFIGSRTLGGQAFAFRDNDRRALMSVTAPREGEVAPTAGHVLLGVGVPLAAGALGTLTALSIF